MGRGKSVLALRSKTINSLLKLWTMGPAFLRRSRRACSSLFSRQNPLAQAPAWVLLSAIASWVIGMVAKLSLNPVPGKLALKSGFRSTESPEENRMQIDLNQFLI